MLDRSEKGNPVRLRDRPAAVIGDENRKEPLLENIRWEGAVSLVDISLKNLFNRASRAIRKSEDLPEHG